MAPLIEARSQLAAKVEDVEGTAETLSATYAILASNIKFDPDVDMEELNLQSSSLSPFPAVAGGRLARMTFQTPLKGSGAAGTPPEISALFRACGLGETTVGGNSVTYAPASASIPSLTMAKYIDGKRYLMAGARGNFTINLNAGKAGIIAFDFLGTSIADSDTSLLSGISYQTTRAQPFQNASLSINSYAAILEALSIESGNAIELRDSANALQGYLSAIIGKRNMKLKLNPEDVLIATHDFWDDWEKGTLVALSATLGATAGNICTITAPKVQYTKIGQGDRKGYATSEIDANLIRNSGDDEISIAFT
jgi:hypothetical protein